jgi:hypothetical protein
MTCRHATDFPNPQVDIDLPVIYRYLQWHERLEVYRLSCFFQAEDIRLLTSERVGSSMSESASLHQSLSRVECMSES